MGINPSKAEKKKKKEKKPDWGLTPCLCTLPAAAGRGWGKGREAQISFLDRQDQSLIIFLFYICVTGRFQSPRPALPHGAGFAFSFQPLGASPRLAGVKQHFQEFQAGEGQKIIIIYI